MTKTVRKFFLKLVLTGLAFLNVQDICAQLDNIHWMPPLHSRDDGYPQEQYVYLSTPVTTPFVVTITDGGGNILAAPTISNATPFVYTVGTSQIPPTPLYVPIDSLNKALTNSGLIFTAPQVFYAEHRVRSTGHAASLTAKGNAAAGTTFRVGGFPMSGNSSEWNFVAGMMATANNTTVTISGYNPGVVFAGVPSVSSPTLVFTLNQGECYVVSGYTNTAANITGFIGALIQSNNPIVLSNGNFLGNVTNAGGKDMGIDQSVPADKIGQNYILIEGNGNANTEMPIVIAHSNNTDIFINGNPAPIATINAGQYYMVPNANYQGVCNRNMHIRTSQPAYMYQSLAGAADEATVALNFIPPYGCGLPDTIDNIAFVNKVGNNTYTGGIFAFTEQGATLKINGVVQVCPEPVPSVPWETYYVTGLTGNVTITSTKGMGVGIFGRDGDAGFAGYYAGFSTIPVPSAGTDVTICSGNSATLNGSGGGSYNWNPSSGLSNATAANPSASPSSTTNYTLTVTDAGGCSANASVTVYVNTPPVVSINGNTTICNGGLVTLTASGGANYSWNTGASTASIIINPTVGSSYTVTGIDANGCSDSASSMVTVNPLPAASISGNTTICTGSSAVLTASGGTDYLWNNGTTTAAITLSPPITTSYTVTVTGAGGCTDTATAVVTVSPPPTAAVSGSTTICSGQTATLTASGGGNYNWSNGATTASINVSPVANTTYSIIVSIGTCSDTASATVTVNLSPSVSVSGNTSLCAGDVATLTASGSTNYSWSNGGATATINVSPGVTTTYTVTTSNGSCTSAASVTVVVSSPPVASANSATICAGQNALLTAMGGGSYSWSNGATTSSINVSPAVNTTYSVIVSIGTCADTASASVVVNPNPVAAAYSDVTITAGDNTTLSASGGTNYVWSNGANSSVITVSPPITTVYCVTVSNGSCTDNVCVTVVIEPIDCSTAGTLYLPNAFSPNNDGENDMLQLYYGEMQCIKTIKLVIYNRWGEKMYETRDPLFKWDGLYNKGLLKSMDQQPNTVVFTYLMRATLITGEEITRKGNISIVR